MADNSWRVTMVALLALCAGGCAGVEETATANLSGLLPKAAARWNEPLRLTARAAGAIEGDFHQPTGRLLFVSGMGGTPSLWLQESAPLGIEAPQLLSLHSGRDAWPRLSPDGRRVLLASGREDAAGDIWLIELERRPGAVMQILSGGGVLPILVRSAQPQRLTGPESADEQPCWHPRGRRIFFASAPSVRDRYEIFEMDLKSGERTCLTTEGGEMPDCSPDGSCLVFTSGRTGEGVNIYVLRLADRAVARLTDGPIDISPCWSADGGSVYFVRYALDTNRDGGVDRDDASSVFSVTFDARVFDDKRLPPARQLTSWEFSAVAPRPVPGGFLFSSNRGRGVQARAPFNLWALPACGEAPEAGTIRGFLWFAGVEKSRQRESDWRLMLAWQNALWAAHEAAYSGRVGFDVAGWSDVAEAALEMGDRLAALGYRDAARERLKALLEDFPASQAYCGLARARLLELERQDLAQVRPEEAAPRWEEHLKQSLVLAADYAARVRTPQEKLSHAEVSLLEAVAARAQLEAGLGLRDSRKYPAALEELKRVTDDYPRQKSACAQALLARAEVFRLFQQPDVAQSALLALLRRYGDVQPEANRAAGLIVDEIAKAADPGRALQQKVSELRALIEKYKYERVLPALAQNRIGDLFAEAKDYHRAREAYRQTIQDFPNAAEQVGGAHLALAAIDLRQDDHERAAETYAELLRWLYLREHDPVLSRRARDGYVNAMLLKARAESDAGDLKLALSTYSSLAGFDQALAEAHRGLVDCLADLGRTDEAISRYRPLAEADPRDDVSHFALARAYSYFGPSDWNANAAKTARRLEIDREALRLINRAVLVRYDVPYYHQLRGFLFNRIAVAAGEDEAKLQALDAYTSALGLSDPEHDPANHAALLFNVAEGYMLVGQEENAYEYYTQALEAGFPLSGARGEAALENMSRSARAAGEYVTAAELLQQLLARLPEELPGGEKERTALLVRRARILDQLALSHYLEGSYAEAADAYARTIQAIQDLMKHHPAGRDRYVRNLVRAQRNQAVNIYHAVERGTLDVRQLERAYGLLVDSVRRVEEVGVVEGDSESPGLFTIDIEVAAGQAAGAAEFDIGAEKRLLYTYLARISALAGDYGQAASFLEKKLALYPRASAVARPDRLTELGVVWSQLGRHRLDGGDLPGAAKAFEEAMELERQAANLTGETADCYSLGRLAVRLAALAPEKRGMTDKAFASWLGKVVRRHKELLDKCDRAEAAHLAEDVAMLNANLAELVPLLARIAPGLK